MSDEHSLFFQQTDLDAEPAVPAGYPTVRARLSAQCPGHVGNIITLAKGKEALKGIMRPKNVGTCPLHIAFYDQTGSIIGHYKLEPGESMNWAEPPSNTYYIKFGCHRDCAGTAILEYDDPNIV